MVIGGTSRSRAKARIDKLARPTSRAKRRAPSTSWCVVSEGGRPFGRGLSLAAVRERGMEGGVVVTVDLIVDNF